MIIRASQTQRQGIVFLAWMLFVAAMVFAVAAPGFVKSYPVLAALLTGGLLVLAVGASLEMFGIKYCNHGSLLVSEDGILIKSIWHKDRFFHWDDIDRFDLLLLDGHDHKSALHSGFYLKATSERKKFVKFPLDLELPPAQLTDQLQAMKNKRLADR